MKNSRSSLQVRFFIIAAMALLPGVRAAAQSLGPEDRDMSRAMLSMVKDDIKNNYYDQTFHGLNLDERFTEAERKIKQATTRDQLMAIVAQALLDFNDSHTFLLPP